MIAYSIFERSLCPECSKPTRLAWDSKAEGWYEVEEVAVCAACAARDTWESEHKKKDAKVEPGLKVRVVDLRDKKATDSPKH